MAFKRMFCCVICFSALLCISYIIIYMELYQGVDVVSSTLLSIITEDTDRKIQFTIDFHIRSQPNVSSHFPPFKLLIGIGAVKCGTTYFQKLLRKAVTHLSDAHLQHFEYAIHGETHFFTECDSWFQRSSRPMCTLAEYLSLLTKHTNLSALNNKTLILSEKTPIYFQNGVASKLLPFYANLNAQPCRRLFFFVLLRHPVRRLWSNMWMLTRRHCVDNAPNHANVFAKLCLSVVDAKYGLDKGSARDVRIMQREAVRLVEHSAAWQPLMHRLIALVASDDFAQRESEMIATVRAMQHDKAHYYADFAMLHSCYYPLIAMWRSHFVRYFEQLPGKYGFEDAFRVIQSELMFEDPYRTMQALLCWVEGVCEGEVFWTGEAQREMDVDMRYAFKQNQAPKDFDVMHVDASVSNVSRVLMQFYAPCNERLYLFLEQHPRVVLSDAGFRRW